MECKQCRGRFFLQLLTVDIGSGGLAGLLDTGKVRCANCGSMYKIVQPAGNGEAGLKELLEGISER